MSRPLLLAAAAVAGSLAAPMAMAADATPSGVLMDQANYWRAKDRPEQALAALQRALLLDPRNADALALSAQIHAEHGDAAATQADLARLRAVQPDDRRIGAIEQTVKVGAIDASALAQARATAQQGRSAQAMELYRGLFHGSQPPDALAVEYFQVLAGTENGWDEARNGLAQYVARNPQDARGHLAYAELLTYRPATRVDGIGRLAILANNAAVGDAAMTAWHQALLWLPANSSSLPLYQAYLARRPDDAGVMQRVTEAQNPPRTPAEKAGAARQDGFAALQAGRLGDAETAFQAALAIDAQDADALGGLGLVRQRQGQAAEAHDLLQKAVAAAPDKAGQWQPALAGLSTSLEMSSANALARRGQYAAAATQLRAAIARGGDTLGAQAALADVLNRSGDLAGAETAYRAVLARQPDNAGALVALAGILNRRGQSDQADALLQRASASGHGELAGRARAEQLRQQAAQTSDPQTALGLLRAASAAAPSDPWIRLDLARALTRSGEAAEARGVMDALVAQGTPSPDALHAAALFASEDHRPADAASLAARIPAGQRGVDVDRILADATFQQKIRQAVAQGGVGGDARAQLLALAASPDPDGSKGAAIVAALSSLGDNAATRQAIATELAVNRNPTPAARLAYAGALLGAGQTADAARLVSTLDAAPDLTPDQRSALAQMRDGIAVRASDKLNEQGRTADAYDQLAPALQRSSTDPDLNLALARLYQSAREPEQALRIDVALLRRDPGNIEARRAAVGAAIQLRRFDDADALVKGGLAASPDDPRTWMMAADLAQARGNNRQALLDLRHARLLRSEQIGAEPGNAAPAPRTVADGDLTANPFREQPAAATDLSLSDVTGTLPSLSRSAGTPIDPTLSQINTQMAAVQAELAPRFTAGVGYRSRSGSPGLDQLSDITTPVEASFAPAGVGRMTVSAVPTLLSAGQLPATPTSLAQFGTGAFGGRAPDNQTAQGVGLSAAYNLRWLDADVGTTPLGFRLTNVVGGLEASPAITDSLHLRITGERRAVTDSLLSYAGTVDPNSGSTFGGVTRTRGHIQLESAGGLANFYAGGGFAQLSGKNVASNSEYEFGAGGTYPVYKGQNDELRVGTDLVYFGYSKNLRYFTLGQGGYFSPQSYFAALIPVEYKGHSDALTWTVGGSVGIQSYTEKSSDVFPNNSDLQSRLEAMASEDPTVVTSYAGKSQSGVVGGVHGSLEYEIDPAIRIGGLIRYDKAGDWNETQASVYARFILNDNK